MKTLPDLSFDLAIVDPPYGIGESKKQRSKGAKGDGRWQGRAKNWEDYTPKDWDNTIPDGRYFTELFRISKHQIIWGWNYFVQYLNTCPSYIVWDKKNGESDFADCETAWCSIEGAARVFPYMWSGFRKEKPEDRIHPTQKPKALYKWLLENYAEPGYKIFDSHLGSGSIAVVCESMGFDFTGCEIDKEYFDNAVARVKKETDLGLFQTPPSSGEGSVGKKNLLF